MLHEDFYYLTETLVALVGLYGLTGRLMTGWEELTHQQSKLRVTRQAELRYISFAGAEPGRNAIEATNGDTRGALIIRRPRLGPRSLRK